MNGNTQALAPNLLERPVVGRNLVGRTLGDNVAGPTLLVFLRHFG